MRNEYGHKWRESSHDQSQIQTHGERRMVQAEDERSPDALLRLWDGSPSEFQSGDSPRKKSRLVAGFPGEIKEER